MTDFFYQHILQRKVNNVWVDQFNVGEQPNTGGKVTRSVERTDYVYQSLIFYPKSASNYMFIAGEEIRIIDGETGRLRIKGNVARFDVGGLEDNRIWI